MATQTFRSARRQRSEDVVSPRRTPRRCIQRVRDDAADVIPLTQRLAASNQQISSDENGDTSSEGILPPGISHEPGLTTVQ